MTDATPQWRNEVVALEDLPAIDDAPFEPLEPRYLLQQRVLWCVWIGLFVVVGAVLVVVLDAPGWVWLPVVVPLVALLAVAWVLEGLAYSHRGVQLRRRDVSTRRGLISRSTISVPFTRVQHVTVERSFTDRLFDLSQVVIFTAGALAADARVKGLDPDRAERLREGIIKRSNIDAGTTTGPAAADVGPD